MELRELGPQDAEQGDDLSRFAFGAGPRGDAAVPWTGVDRGWGAFDHSRLVAAAYVQSHQQWWGGRTVAMASVAGVAVHPDARGHGLAHRLVQAVLERSGAAVAVLYPTAPAIYRQLGFELVGSLDRTPVPLAGLSRDPVPGVTVGPGTPEQLAASYAELAPQVDGLVARTGTSFPAASDPLLRRDLLQVARDDGGTVVGHVALDRGTGYDGTAQLRLWELLASTAEGYRALLASLASWDSVAGSVLWRGPTAELGLHLAGRVPAPSTTAPWMLAVLDLPAAVAQRGFRGSGSARFAVDGRGWLLEAADGTGTITPLPAAGLPELSRRGLALAFAGAPAARSLRAGLLSGPVPGLDAVLAGPTPELLDYF